MLGLLAQGRTNPEIAAAVGCSVHTVKAHVRAVLKKMRVADRRQATAVYWGYAPDPLAEEAQAWWEGLPGRGARNPDPKGG